MRIAGKARYFRWFQTKKSGVLVKTQKVVEVLSSAEVVEKANPLIISFLIYAFINPSKITSKRL